MRATIDISTENTKNMKYLCIMRILKELRIQGAITESKLQRAQSYYQQLTGADLVLPE